MKSHRGTLSRFRLILCSPKFPGNVGSAARVAANFGLSELVIVTPACDWLAQESRSRAVAKAASILENAQVTDSLQAALQGSNFALGFTRRTGSLRKPVLFDEILPRLSGPARVALVFGNEETGLTHDELRLCTAVAQLSTDPMLPSLNLSHAVAVVLSRLHEEFSGARQTRGHKIGEIGETRAKLQDVEALFQQWRELLVEVGLTTAGNPDRMLGRMREILNRSDLQPQDVKLFRGFLSKTQRAVRR